MDKNNQSNFLIKVNKNSIIYKVKQFFRNLFKRKEIFVPIEKKADIVEEQKKQQHNSSNNDFLERIKNVEDEHTLLLKLQKQYENGEILEKDLSQEQIKALCDLYDTQIEQLKASNEQRKQKILEYMNNTSNT